MFLETLVETQNQLWVHSTVHERQVECWNDL